MANGTTYWLGEGIPNWIAAVGGLVATGVAVAGFIGSRRNKAGLANVAEAVAARENTPEPGQAVVWAIRKIGTSTYGLVNTSDVPAHVIEVHALERGVLRFDFQTPLDVQPQQMLSFRWFKTLQTPSVITVRVRWSEGSSAAEHEATLPVY